MPLTKPVLAGLALALCAAFAAPRSGPSLAPAFTGEIMPAFHVKDLAAAKRWYREVLGFEVVYDLAEQGWCELATPTKDAKLGLAADATAGGSNQAYCAFGVRDMDAAKSGLARHGVTFEGDVVELPGIVKLLYFRDPDQNRLMFFQSLAPSARPAEAASR